MVFVTGGEPSHPRGGGGPAPAGLPGAGMAHPGAETAGGPDCWPDDFNVSPKLATGITGAPTRHPSGSARRRSPNCWRRAGRSGSSSPPTSMTWTRSTGGSNGSGCRSTTSESCQRHQHRRPDRPYPAAGRGRAGPWPEPHHSLAHPRLGLNVAGDGSRGRPRRRPRRRVGSLPESAATHASSRRPRRSSRPSA